MEELSSATTDRGAAANRCRADQNLRRLSPSFAASFVAAASQLRRQRPLHFVVGERGRQAGVTRSGGKEGDDGALEAARRDRRRRRRGIPIPGNVQGNIFGGGVDLRWWLPAPDVEAKLLPEFPLTDSSSPYILNRNGEGVGAREVVGGGGILGRLTSIPHPAVAPEWPLPLSKRGQGSGRNSARQDIVAVASFSSPPNPPHTASAVVQQRLVALQERSGQGEHIRCYAVESERKSKNLVAKKMHGCAISALWWWRARLPLAPASELVSRLLGSAVPAMSVQQAAQQPLRPYYSAPKAMPLTRKLHNDKVVLIFRLNASCPAVRTAYRPYQLQSLFMVPVQISTQKIQNIVRRAITSRNS
uniref:Uncharacterized protein n=1 Tax=Leersia perrieri TaxID=77586 RepID=A0A0D9V7N1_9ORYZ